MANASRPRSVVVDFAIMETKDITSSKSGLFAYINSRSFPKLKQSCHAVLGTLTNNYSLVHACPAITPEIHLVDATVVVIGSPVALVTSSVMPNVDRKLKTVDRIQFCMSPQCITSSTLTQPRYITPCDSHSLGSGCETAEG